MTTPTLSELAVRRVQRVYVECAAYLGGSSQGSLPLSGGSVTADCRRSVMRDGSISIAPAPTTAGLTLSEAYDLLCTPGLELAITRGYELADGSRVSASLGRFVVGEPAETEDSLSTPITDLSQRISLAHWTDPYQIASGTALADALNALLQDRWPDVQTSISTSTCPDLLGAQAVFEAGEDSDPWADARGLAAAHGYELYFDTAGVATVTRVTDAASSSPVFTFARGTTAIVTARTRTSPLERVYNGIIVSGEGSDVETPVRGEAWDDNPASPTYYLGPLGKRPRFYSSPLITTESQAETVAEEMKAGILGRVQKLSWEHVPHVGLKPLDVVAVESADGSLPTYILDALTIPLEIAGKMSAEAREIVVRY